MIIFSNSLKHLNKIVVFAKKILHYQIFDSIFNFTFVFFSALSMIKKFMSHGLKFYFFFLNFFC